MSDTTNWSSSDDATIENGCLQMVPGSHKKGLMAHEREGKVFGRFLPNRVVAGAVGDDPAGSSGLPLLEGRAPAAGKPTAFVCRNYACELPVTDASALAGQLENQR